MYRIGLLLFACGALHAAVPEPIPGWRMELVAEAPRVKHPSVVACAPDGRVFVAEDPMDISLPNAGAAEGRILCLQTNGQITVFAEKLYAVFGLQYLEGRVYVLHNPKFSVFDDDHGVGRNRRDLIEQTLPEPSALNWNDHIPANFRLAMDGFFYVACGDKGLYRARGTDGSTATLSSGGVFRIRPDGSQLEVFSHGVRNILDVALNAEDEIFTYDNTDEHDWMGRFTHMVEAGFYGYPHDFIPRRPYTLWMMDDFGAGAACGAFAYNEDALPPEYHGNVFISDFGKRQVMRVRIERAGGSYKVVSKEDMFPNPPGDFRPVGITLGPDGKSIYICDWQHRDEKANVSVGRLWKLSWTGQDHSAPKPGWYPAATLSDTNNVPVSTLSAALAHPAQSVRLAAQRKLAVAKATNELRNLLINSNAPALARAHALWALDAIDAGASARPQIIEAARTTNAILTRQAIRQLGTRKAAAAILPLREQLRSPHASIRFHAATALGRIGDKAPVPDLIDTLAEPDLFARYAVFTALNRIGRAPGAWSEIVEGLERSDARVREGTVFALRETYDVRLLAGLVALYHRSSAPFAARQAALELIASLHHRKPDWKGEWWAYHPALQPPPPKTEAWTGTSGVLEVLRESLRERNPLLRRIAMNALVAARDTNSAGALREIFPGETDPETRASILRALGGMKDSDAIPLVIESITEEPPVNLAAIQAAGELGGDRVIEALTGLLKTGQAPPEAIAESITVLARLEARQAATAIEQRAADPAATVRAASVQALARLKKTEAMAVLDSAIADSAPEVRVAAVKALDQIRHKDAVATLLKAYRDESLRSEAFFALTRVPDERALDPLLEGLASKNAAHRNAAHLAVRTISAAVLKRIEAKADSLPQQALTELRQIYAGNTEAERGPLFATQIKQHTPEEYLRAATELSGNADRGRTLFFDANGVNCVSCHRVAGTGSDTGPDLTSIGAQFDRRALAESVIYPSKAVREGYQQINIDTADESFSGVIKGETADAVTLRDSSGREHKIPRAAITARRNSALSLMPEGLHQGLSLAEFADLIAYLGTLKAQPSK
jgi:putative membrane-bound dehydrogenase-like protein